MDVIGIDLRCPKCGHKSSNKALDLLIEFLVQMYNDLLRKKAE